MRFYFQEMMLRATHFDPQDLLVYPTNNIALLDTEQAHVKVIAGSHQDKCSWISQKTWSMRRLTYDRYDTFKQHRVVSL